MNWLWNIAAQKAVKTAVQAVIAILGQAQIQALLNSAGVSVSIDPTIASASLYGVLEFVRGWLKHKLGVKFL